jgi:nitrogen fixation NifU-like protein
VATETQSQDELRDLYRELILDHARSPRHFGKLNGATHSAEGINPLCGDKLKVYFDIDADQQIQDARFEGSGCAISMASASLLTDTVIGLTTARATDFFSAFVTLLRGEAASNDSGDATVDLGKLKALAGVREFPSRVKCATLAWHAFNAAIHNDSKPASTE